MPPAAFERHINPSIGLRLHFTGSDHGVVADDELYALCCHFLRRAPACSNFAASCKCPLGVVADDELHAFVLHVAQHLNRLLRLRRIMQALIVASRHQTGGLTQALLPNLTMAQHVLANSAH